ncbi:MAG: hypothetical protein KDC92_04235 [Bacteroidetes bacterium]|nr:hypothetical protein [Bacteroidota bacterium]
MKFFKATLLIALILSITSTYTFAELNHMGKKKYLLEFKPKKGKTGQMDFVVDMDMNMNINGTQTEMNMLIKMGAEMNVTEANPNRTTTSFKYNYMAMGLTNQYFGTLSYDSRSDTSSAYAKAVHEKMKPLFESENYMTQDKHGELIDSKFAKELTENAGAGGTDMSAIMASGTFPKTPIAIGKSWKSTVDNPASPMKIKTTYTLADVRDGKVYIDMVSKVSTNKNHNGSQNIKKASGTQTGQMVFDEKTMWFISGSLTQDLEMTVEQNGQKIPADVNSEITFSVE